MIEPVSVAAIDLGATSGRVVRGSVGRDTLVIRDVARFPNGAAFDGAGALRWNVSGLFDATVDGLRTAFREDCAIRSVAIDSWAVDYALLRNGQLLDEPFSYRDARTARGVDLVHAIHDHSTLYARNGLQFLPFNTVYQLACDRADGRLRSADRALLIPDLLAYWLTGREFSERTNASTTGLLDARTTPADWDRDLIADLGIPAALLAPIIEPGTVIGEVVPDVARMIGGSPQVVAVGSHDTASAVVGVPAETSNFAYISSGTWSLIGVELDEPLLHVDNAASGFTNEAGVDGTVRYLHNVMGLWLISESMRTWSEQGTDLDLAQLLTAAAEIGDAVAVFDPDDERLLPPGDMPSRIAEILVERGQRVPATPAQLVRCILESLAATYAKTLRQLVELTGKRIEVVHVVGGGSLNELLCQLTADRTGLPVLAGPVEATAMGNLLVQARTLGATGARLADLRALVARTHPPKRYTPRS